MKVGIIGVAHMHVYSYVECLKQLDVEIVGVYDRDEALASDFCKRSQLNAVKSLHELLESDIDTVLICSENSYHCEYSLLAAKHKKHIIVEKPMALSVKEADQMIHAAQVADVKLIVAHPVRFTEPMQSLKKAVENGKVGAVVGINATNHGKIPGGWFVQSELSGGGAIMDHTIHMADLVYWMFEPEIQSVYAMDGHGDTTIEVEDTGLLHIRFTNGMFMSLDTSWNRPAEYPVWGDASLMLISDKGFVHADGFGRKGIAYTDKQSFHYYEDSMDMGLMRACKRAIENDLPSPVPAKAGRFTVEMAELAYQSIREQKIIIKGGEN